MTDVRVDITATRTDRILCAGVAAATAFTVASGVRRVMRWWLTVPAGGGR